MEEEEFGLGVRAWAWATLWALAGVGVGVGEQSRLATRRHGGNVSSVLVRDPPPLPALRANLVPKGQQLLAVHIAAPKAPKIFFSFPLPIVHFAPQHYRWTQP